MEVKRNFKKKALSLLILLSIVVTVSSIILFSSSPLVQAATTFTFGNNSGSGSSYSSISANEAAGGEWTSPATAGVVNQIVFYGATSSGSHNVKCIITTTGGTILTNGISNSVATSNTAGWFTASFATPPAYSASTTYALAIIPDSTAFRLYYSSSSGGTQEAYTADNYASPTNPTWTHTNSTNYRIYANVYEQVPIVITSSSTGSGFVTVDSSAVTTPHTYTWNVGDTHTIAANNPANQIVGQSQYAYTSWSDSGAQSHTYTVPSAGTTVSANFQLQYYLTVTGGSSPTGQGWKISGSTATAGNAWIWNTVAGQSRSALTNWQKDGVNQNPSRSNTGTFTTPSITMSTYHTVNFVSAIQYFLTVTGGNSVGYGTASPTSDNWYDSGGATTVHSNWVWGTVAGQSRTALTNWQLDASNQNPARVNSGTLTTSSVTMSTYHTVNFVSVSQYYLTETGGNNVGFGLASQTSDQWYDSGSSTTVSSDWVWSTIAGQSRITINNYALDGSNQNPARQYSGTLTSSSITMSTYHTVAFASNTQYCLTVSSVYATPSGAGWYDSGATAYAGLDANTVSGGTGIRYVFSGWSSGGSSYSSDAVVMSTYYTDSASWITQYYLTVSSAYGSPTGDGWYNSGDSASFGTSTIDTIVSGQSQRIFSSWAGTGAGSYSGASSSSSVSMNNPISESASWVTQYYFSVASDYGSPSGDGWYNSGSTVSSTVSTPVSGGTGIQYITSSWSGSGSLSSGGSYNSVSTGSFSITQYSTCIWNWQAQYLITPIANAHTSTAPSSPVWVNSGGSHLVSYSAASGYSISSVLVDGSSVSISGSYNFVNVVAPHTISVAASLTPTPTPSPTPSPSPSPSPSPAATSTPTPGGGGGGGGGNNNGGGGFRPIFDVKITSCPASFSISPVSQTGIVNASLTNQAQSAEFSIKLAITDSSGATAYTETQSLLIGSTDTKQISWSFPVPASAGTYSLSLSINGLTTSGNTAHVNFLVKNGFSLNLGILNQNSLVYGVLVIAVIFVIVVLLGRRK